MNTETQSPRPVGSSAWLGIWSITLNVGIVVAGWLAVNGNAGCGYITKFLAAATVVISPIVIVALINPEKPDPLREWVSHISDACMVAMMVWNGWLWCAGAFAYGWLLCFILFAARKAHAAKMPNDPSSATRPTRACDCNSEAMAGFAAAHG